MDAIVNAFTSYGLNGVIIGALFFNNYNQSKRHELERTAWLNKLDEFHEDVMQILLKERG